MYVIANIVSAIIPFILLPILTRSISQEEYGFVAVFQSMLTGFGSIVGFSVHGAASRKYFDNPSVNEMARYNGACVQILLISYMLGFFAIYCISDSVFSPIGIEKIWVYLALTTSSLSFIVQLRLGQWQVRKRAVAYVSLQLSQASINAILALIFVFILKKSGEGVVMAIFYSASYSALISIIFLYKDKIVKLNSINKSDLEDALSFGIPLIPHAVGLFLLNYLDRYVISNYMDLKYVGIYAVAFQISMGLTIIFDGINKAFVPHLFGVLSSDDNDKKKKVVRYTYFWFIFLLISMVLAFMIGPKFVLYYAGDNFSESAQIIGLLCAGQIFGGMYLMVTNYVFYAKRTAHLSLVTIFSALAYLMFSILLVENNGLVGVAFSFLASKLIQFIFTWLLSMRSVQMDWRF